MAINLVAITALLGLLMLKGAGSRRGAILLWLLVAVLIALSLFEIAHA